MPDLAFAAGALNGFLGTMDKERARKDDNNRFIVKTLLESGRVANIGDLAPFLNDQLSPTGTAPKPKSGGGGKGKQPDPTQILGLMLNPILQKHHDASGQPGVPQAAAQAQQQQVTPPQPQVPQGTPTNIGGRDVNLLTSGDVAQMNDASAQRELDRNFEDWKRKQVLTAAERQAEIKLQVAGRKGTADRQATQDEDGTWSIKVRDGQGEVIYRQPANSPDKDLEKRITDYEAQGMSREEASAQASADRTLERKQEMSRRVGLIRATDLTNEEKRRSLAGQITFKDSLTIAGRIAANDPSMSRDQMAEFARAIYSRFGPEGKGVAAAEGGEKPPAPATTPGAAPTAAASTAAPANDLWSGKVKPGKLNAEQTKLVQSGRTALELVPTITGLIEKAGLTNDKSVGAAANTRWKNFLYAQGVDPGEFNQQLQQYAGAVQAFMLRSILPGRSNIDLQHIYMRHIPDPAKDSPGMLYEKTKTLAKIISLSMQTALDDASSTPDQIAAKIKQQMLALDGTDAKADPRRAKVRQRLLTNGYEATPDTIDQYLKNHPDFK